MPSHESAIVSQIRQRLQKSSKREYWRCLDELAQTPEFLKSLESEFPQSLMPLSQSKDGETRRHFLQIMAASFVLAGLSGCGTQSAKQIVPYRQQPEDLIPGKPLFYATAVTLNGVASGVLVESNMGRPTKVEGNPDHPSSLGATDIFSQAAILSLYDPQRSQSVLNQNRISTWSDFTTALAPVLAEQESKQGAGLRVLTGAVTSPTFASQMQALAKKFPKFKWCQYEPISRDNSRAGAKLAFGEDVNCIYDFTKADMIVSFDADFLTGVGSVRYAHDFTQKRTVRAGTTQMSRLYVLESTPSLTGAAADHKLPVSPVEIETIAVRLVSGAGISLDKEPGNAVSAIQEKWLDILAKELDTHRGSSLILAGESQPPFVHAAAHALNAHFGNAGKTVRYTVPLEAGVEGQMQSMQELTAEMSKGDVTALLIIDTNPAYTAYADLKFAEAMAKVPFRAQMGLYKDETTNLCHWHIPQTHEFEAWSDARGHDGTVTILQPLIEPLYNGKSQHELLDWLLNREIHTSYSILRDFWQSRITGDFEKGWRRAIHDGIVADSALPEKNPAIANKALAANPTKSEKENYLLFKPDPSVWDGRFANNGWLHELPNPLTKLTWENAILLSPALATKHGIRDGDSIEVRTDAAKLEGVAMIAPGQEDNCIAMTLGYGRSLPNCIADGLGCNAYPHRTSAAPWHQPHVALRELGSHSTLATTQHHHSMEGRDPVRMATLKEFITDPHLGTEKEGEESSVYPLHKYEGHAWGMTIDLNVCTGCSACVLACQSENNIPIVGKDEIQRGREMHWLRIDRYYKGGLENPETVFEPLACVHCEQAPCEPVCPVGATTHSGEGLNQMVYNRCVGTRYCSNNCPYKVRRFNFYQYSDIETPALQLMHNPDVTVRDRGVMEKCTYCVQRINAAKIEAEKESRPVKDGEIKTACQAACPASAIVFGDINDSQSAVATLRGQPHAFGLLSELGTRPRTTYLARLRNPHPELEPAAAKGASA